MRARSADPEIRRFGLDKRFSERLRTAANTMRATLDQLVLVRILLRQPKKYFKTQVNERAQQKRQTILLQPNCSECRASGTYPGYRTCALPASVLPSRFGRTIPSREGRED